MQKNPNSEKLRTAGDWLVARARERETWLMLDRLLAKWGVLALLALAAIYYAQYYRSELNLGGEGGTTAVIALRLMEGQLPFIDTYLGYNVMWFYPVVALFQLTGPDFVALRIYFFVLCAAIGIFGFLTVRRVTGIGWLSLGVGVLLILIPGMLFRNYMGLLPVLNGWALVGAFCVAHRKGWRTWLAYFVGGLVLGLTYLVRTDLGHFFLIIYLGAALLIPFGRRGRVLGSIGHAILAATLVLGGAVAVHSPVYFDARARGFDQEFLGQYSNQVAYFRHEIESKILGVAAPPENPSATRIDSAAPPEKLPKKTNPVKDSGGESSDQRAKKKDGPSETKAAPAKKKEKLAKVDSDQPLGEVDDEADSEDLPAEHTRPRGGVAEFMAAESFYDRAFIIALYLPVLVALVLVGVASIAFLRAIWRVDESLKREMLACLLLAGSALTVFPQYFFFRPDTPHLAEFMCPFLIAMACASFVAVRAARRSESGIARIAAVLFVALCVVTQGIYVYHSYPKTSAGTIAAKRKRSHEFIADNGVRVFVKRREAERLRDMFQTIVAHAEPGDWLITYPYSPTINFMTNRPSYLYNLYVDNATAPPNFNKRTRREIREFEPAVIVIDDRPINNTEMSQFSNWAKEVHGFIERNYELVGEFESNSVYARPDRAAAVRDKVQQESAP